MSMLIEIKPDYTGRTKLTAEQQRVITSHAVGSIEFVKEGDFVGLGWSVATIIVSADVLSAFVGWEVVRSIDNESTRALATFGQRNTTIVNEKVSVAVAGLGLLTVNQVENWNDLCTVELQTKLDQGWRILAVCVQPDQRRPDYILGRSTSEMP